MNTSWIMRLCDGLITALLWLIAGLGALIAWLAGQLPQVALAMALLLAGWWLARRMLRRG